MGPAGPVRAPSRNARARSARLVTGGGCPAAGSPLSQLLGGEPSLGPAGGPAAADARRGWPGLDLGRRHVGNGVGLLLALEAELRLRPGASLRVDHHDLARLQLAEEDLLG